MIKKNWTVKNNQTMIKENQAFKTKKDRAKQTIGSTLLQLQIL